MEGNLQIQIGYNCFGAIDGLGWLLPNTQQPWSIVPQLLMGLDDSCIVVDNLGQLSWPTTAQQLAAFYNYHGRFMGNNQLPLMIVTLQSVMGVDCYVAINSDYQLLDGNRLPLPNIMQKLISNVDCYAKVKSHCQFLGNN